ncbi:uncharacterized protein J8A68_005075 [[Candida] subhashii]|uniref:Uncharacterized protein n=1 Tax=[Candida] subhashii TaxID=561895 RepID=A0A8J5QHA6_9ASCO|nr:uncharacterized protein J8A68_005075 [[Candida] subhashii]KAG7661380.1 hypothetical protein J8A68_005075 [[Candida] subhashii]
MSRPSIHSRTTSIASTNIIKTPSPINLVTIDINELYKHVIKVILLEYSNEARFWTPIIEPNVMSNKRASRMSILYDQNLPDSAMKMLNEKLKSVMTNTTIVDEKTRRSLLRLYGELLDPSKEKDLKKVDYLIPKFAACANQELKKIYNYADDELSEIVFSQTRKFIDMLINIVNSTKEKDSAIISKLQDTKQSFTSSKQRTPSTQDQFDGNVKYPKKSYRLTDFNKSSINLLKSLFNVDDIKLQQDVFKYKDISLAKPLHRDIKEFLQSGRNLDTFTSAEARSQCKERQKAMADQLMSKYKIPADSTLLSIPPVPQGEQYYVLPKPEESRSLFFMLAKLIVGLEKQIDYSDPDKPYLGKASLDLISVCARLWLIDFPTRVVAIYTAGHDNNAFMDSPQSDSKKISPINMIATQKVFSVCKKIITDAGMEWEDKDLWAIEDQQGWVSNLAQTYNQIFVSIRENLSLIFNTESKPKFGPLLMFLGDYIESDSLFPKIEESGITKKWEKRLTKFLLKVAGTRYGEYLANLPRDNTLSVIHVFNICDSLVGDIKTLQKRYKNPLLGFLNVSRTVAAITTGMFASDAKVILTHIKNYAAKKGEFIPYGDALEIYQSLSEIRDIHNQVTPAGSKFQFDLEEFFFPFLEAWIEESNEKIRDIVKHALESDAFVPIDLGDDAKKNSNAVLDIFVIIKQYLTTLKKQNWCEEFQLAKVYTTLLKSISNGALFYSEEVTAIIAQDLEPPKELNEDKDLNKASNWLNEVKNVVSNIQNFTRHEPEIVYNFQPRTCIALNNLSAMMNNLTKLEEWLDPESISNSLSTYDPNSKSRYLSHVFTLRIIRGENLRSSETSVGSRVNPYVSLVDFKAKKLIGKTRSLTGATDPDWDEEFEITLPPNTTLELSTLVWDEKFAQHQLCGKAFLELNPRKFKHDGMPQEIYLDLDLQGRLAIEVAVESETHDAIFVMGRAYRALKRSQERAIKLIVEKFSGFIEDCFSRANLKSVCGKGQPSKEEFESAIENLCDYLNMNLSVLKHYLTDEIFMKVMVETWKVVVSRADELLLPKLSKAKINADIVGKGWQSMSSKFATVSLGILGNDAPLTINELETVLGWLNLLASFFHNEGNGPPMEELKTDKYQSLLFIPTLYDQPDEYLIEEVEHLSPAYAQMLSNRNNFDVSEPSSVKQGSRKRSVLRTESILRSKTILANATSKARAQAAEEAKENRADPTTNKILKEDIILRLLIARGRKDFVSQRLNQRAKLAYSMATERLARAAAERRFT